MRQILIEDKVDDKEYMALLEKEILSLANKQPESLFSKATHQLMRWAGARKVLTIEQLMVDFARKDHHQLLQRNPALTEADLAALVNMIGSYLIYSTQDQQRTRAEELIGKLEQIASASGAGAAEYEETANQLAQSMQATRHYDPAKQPAYLVFEYFANISMRESQVKKLGTFLAGDKPNQVMEMIMGSGKSKILLPLLGLMRADRKNLSMLIVPQPLFTSIAGDTKEILQNAFAHSLRGLHFDRDTKFTLNSMETILDDLRSIKQNKECLIMTSKSVQCLLLKFAEESSAYLSGPNRQQDFPEHLKIMRKILLILSESGYPIIDEADSVLNALHEVSFSAGQRLYRHALE